MEQLSEQDRNKHGNIPHDFTAWLVEKLAQIDDALDVWPEEG